MQQIPASFEIFHFFSGEGQDQVIRSYLPPAGERRLSTVLEPFSLSRPTFLQHLNRTGEFKRRFPWVILIFPREYHLAGHIYSRRTNPEDPLFSSYTIIREYGSEPMKKPPDCSLLTYFSPAAGAALKETSYFFQTCWELIKDKPPDRSWLVFAPPLDEDWVKKNEMIDAQLFYTHYLPTEDDLAPAEEEK